MSQTSNIGLVQKRRGNRRRQKARLALKLGLSLGCLALAMALSAGIIRVVERPVPPWKTMAPDSVKAIVAAELQANIAATLEEIKPPAALEFTSDLDPAPDKLLQR